MIGILLTKFRLTIRKPWSFIILTAVCILFAFFIGQGSSSKMVVPVFSEIPNEKSTLMLKKLNESDVFTFESVDEQEMRTAVQDGNTEAGLYIREIGFSVLVSSHSSNIAILKQFVQKVYSNNQQKDELLNSLASEQERVDAEEIWEQSFAEPMFSVEKENFRNNESKIMENQLHGIFGFSLFFVIYTIAFNVISILEEKQDRIWDRMILSSVKKWEMYAGNLLYSFIMGYLQVLLIFLAFHYGAGVDFYGGFSKTLIVLIPYVLSIVALCILIAGLSKSLRQFNSFISILSVSLSMLGGAYWPIEIVTSDVMLFLSNFSPILYGMEALKGATIYGSNYLELLQPMSILLLMSVVMMGIGINVMERRKI